MQHMTTRKSYFHRVQGDRYTLHTIFWSFVSQESHEYKTQCMYAGYNLTEIGKELPPASIYCHKKLS